MRKVSPGRSEAIEQRMLITWSSYYWFASYLFAVPNGGQRSKLTAANLKREGVKAGVPDLFFAVPSDTHHGLFIEMKRAKGGKLSDKQSDCIERLKGVGYDVCVAHGFEEAKAAIKKHLGEEYMEKNRYINV